jgi:hypothetical protein
MQPKLVVGEVNDPLEHEADCAADQVMRMAPRDLAIAAAPPQLSASGRGEECDECANERGKLQRSTTPPAEPPIVPHGVDDVLRSNGQPLDSQTRAFMERRFGHDFSQVCVHADQKAAESARAVNAVAYIV